ncbi:MAG: PA14 domain-containing protein [Candidatus Korarchaeota archaeon]|nr:PA14 domain-containing protein [Candidatus Korarchaeota archaeon]
MPGFLFIRVREGRINGLRGRYYVWRGEKPPTDTSLLDAITERIDPQVNFTWWDSPAPGVPPGYFLVEWTGYLYVAEGGAYRIYVVTDDGSKVWLDGELIIDAWQDQAPRVYHSAPLVLESGYHRIRYLFYNRYPFAVARLGWLKPDGTAEIIPRESLVTRGGESIVVRGVPDGYTVEVWSSSRLGVAVSRGRTAVIDASSMERPVDGYIRILDTQGRRVAESPAIRDLWGGDVFEFAEEAG